MRNLFCRIPTSTSTPSHFFTSFIPKTVKLLTPHYSQKIRLIFNTPQNFRRHYDVLEIPPDADRKLIKSQFYKLSKKYHPDVNANDETAHAKFLQINEAYSILINDHSRREYDRIHRVSENSHARYSSRHTRHRVRRHPSTSFNKGEEYIFSKSGRFDRHRRGSKFNFDEHYQRHYGEEMRRTKAAAERDKQNNINKDELQKEDIFNRAALRVVLVVGVILMIGGSGGLS